MNSATVSDQFAKIEIIKVVDRLQDSYQYYYGGFGRYPVPVRQIKLIWDGRTSPVLNRYHEDGEFYYVHNWARQDGNTESYDQVLDEAETNGLNPGLQDQRGIYRKWLKSNGY